MATQASTRSGRLAAFALVACAVGSGIVGFLLGGAPLFYALTNGGALATVALALSIPAGSRAAWLAPLVCFAGLAALFAPLAVGPETSGVHRWLAIGPLRFHAGMIVVPAMAVALPMIRAPWRLSVLAAAMAIAWFQPDLATALALALAAVVATLDAANWQRLTTFGVATAGVLATALRPDPLLPVKFVETALDDAWRAAPAIAVVMAVTLLSALAFTPWLTARRSPAQRAGAMAASGAFAGYALASLAMPFPQPLIGYGASPILGMGLALAVLRFSR